MSKTATICCGLALAGSVLVSAACVAARQSDAVPDSPAPEAKKSEPVLGRVLTGKEALGDWTTDAPGVRRRITVADLPPPYETPNVDNGPHMVSRPEGAWPKAPAGFKVEEFATRLNNPRKILTAPNGDVFVVESGPGRVEVLHGMTTAGKPESVSTFATGLDQPFGIAFYPNGANPQYVYIGNTGSVVRFPYRNGDLKARGPSEMIVENIPSGGRLRGGGHWTRDVAFSLDNRRMFVSVGSSSNVGDGPREDRRADILAFTPEGKNETTYAYGVRNAVGIAVQPGTGVLWMSVNERDNLGDHLPPDYVSHVEEGGFYGWPWYYMGGHQDPRHRGAHPELASKVVTPDVLVQSHMASLCLTFYTASNFPSTYKNDIFAAEHGSWNRARRTGYKVIRVPLKNGKATGEYEDFLTGFVTPDGDVWGRPVGVTVARDGSLLVSDDGSGTIWRVVYEGKR